MDKDGDCIVDCASDDKSNDWKMNCASNPYVVITRVQHDYSCRSGSEPVDTETTVDDELSLLACIGWLDLFYGTLHPTHDLYLSMLQLHIVMTGVLCCVSILRRATLYLRLLTTTVLYYVSNLIRATDDNSAILCLEFDTCNAVS